MVVKSEKAGSAQEGRCGWGEPLATPQKVSGFLDSRGDNGEVIQSKDYGTFNHTHQFRRSGG